VAKLKEALQKSEKPERIQHAASWKVYRADAYASGQNFVNLKLVSSLGEQRAAFGRAFPDTAPLHDQPLAYRVQHDFSRVMKIQLLHQVGAVCFDRG
jgi:hypothetical protein